MARPLHYQPSTLPQLNDSVAFFLVHSFIPNHRVLSSYYHVEYLTQWVRSNFLTGKKSDKSIHSFKKSVAMGTKPINSEAVNFFLSACCIEAFNFTIWSFSSKRVHDRVFKATSFAFVEVWIYLSVDQDPNAYKDRSAWVDTTSRGGRNWPVSIPTKDLHKFFEFRLRVSSTTAFSVNTVDGPPTTSSRFFPKDLHLPQWMDRILQQLICVDKCRPGLVKYNQNLTYRYLYRGKRQSFLLCPQSWQNIFIIIPARKVLDWSHLFLLPYLLQVFYSSRVWLWQL